jgi:hypothetical protein
MMSSVDGLSLPEGKMALKTSVEGSVAGGRGQTRRRTHRGERCQYPGRLMASVIAPIDNRESPTPYMIPRDVAASINVAFLPIFAARLIVRSPWTPTVSSIASDFSM